VDNDSNVDFKQLFKKIVLFDEAKKKAKSP